MDDPKYFTECKIFLKFEVLSARNDRWKESFPPPNFKQEADREDSIHYVKQIPSASLHPPSTPRHVRMIQLLPKLHDTEFDSIIFNFVHFPMSCIKLSAFIRVIISR